MKIQDIKNIISIETYAFFADNGFILNKHSLEYVKRSDDFNFIFKIDICSKTGWFSVSTLVFVGCKIVNKILNDALGLKNKVNGPTFGFGINKICPHRGRYSIENEQELIDIIHCIKYDFNEIAIHWFSGINSLSSIDNLLNPIKGNMFKPDSAGNAYVGLIVAFLVKNIQFQKIFYDYYEFFLKNYNKSVAYQLIRVNDYLSNLVNITTNNGCWVRSAGETRQPTVIVKIK